MWRVEFFHSGVGALQEPKVPDAIEVPTKFLQGFRWPLYSNFDSIVGKYKLQCDKVDTDCNIVVQLNTAERRLTNQQRTNKFKRLFASRLWVAFALDEKWSLSPIMQAVLRPYSIEIFPHEKFDMHVHKSQFNHKGRKSLPTKRIINVEETAFLLLQMTPTWKKGRHANRNSRLKRFHIRGVTTTNFLWWHGYRFIQSKGDNRHNDSYIFEIFTKIRYSYMTGPIKPCSCEWLFDIRMQTPTTQD